MPVLLHAAPDAVPIEVNAVFNNNVVYIGAVVTFAVLHVNFAPQKFFGRNKFYGHAVGFASIGMLKPDIVYVVDVVYRVKNDIDVIIVFENFGQPAYIGQFGVKTQIGK